MIIDKKDNISIITQEKVSVLELNKKLETLYPKFKNDNIIISLSSLESVKIEAINEFLKISKQHRNANLSFVIVVHNTDFNAIPNDIIAVPTLQEAFDIIEMENIERDLGF